MTDKKRDEAKDYVLKMTVVLPQGKVIHVGCRAGKSSSGYDLARLFIGSEGTLGVVTMAVLIAPIILFAPRIISLFDPSAHPVLMEAGTSYIRINTIMLPMAAIAMVANGALRGAGDSLPAMFSTFFTRGVASLSAVR